MREKLVEGRKKIPCYRCLTLNPCEKLMMQHTNGPIFNLIAWATTIVLIAFTLLLFIQMI